MTDKDTEEAQARQTGPDVPGPDVMLSLWACWMDQAAATAQPPSDLGAAWWEMTVNNPASNLVTGDVNQLQKSLSRDPTLRSIDQMWNANPLREVIPVDWAEIARALRIIWMRSLRKPSTALAVADLNQDLWRSALEVWHEAGQHWLGMVGSPPEKEQGSITADKRFAAPEWHTNPIYRTLQQVYLLASDWLMQQGDVEGMDEAEQRRINFHLRQFVDATSPALMLLSNPAALQRAIETGGTSIAAGAANLVADLNAGRLSMVDAEAFSPGQNLALTPGKVVHRNRLIELIQYTPTTEKAHKTPLLIVPPWINKYYILDMQPKNSLVRYLVEQGFTVFLTSWKNPDASMDEIGIEDYMDLGPIEASDVTREITGSPTVNVMGYCTGGTLLTMTLAVLAAKGDKRFNSASFMVSLQDFSRVGDTAVFMDEPGIDLIEQQMMERGYLDSREMANMFNLLRSNDLIWANVVNNYLMGSKPPAFDLLYWNSDGTRMARTAHSWYLRNTYVENNLIRPNVVRLKGEMIDLGRVHQDTYAVGAEKDHIVPWDAAWRITQLFGGNVRFVLASSGHIAGIINPPGGKGTYWTQDETAAPVSSAEAWRQQATQHEGSWWSDWTAWLTARSGRKGALPQMGCSKYPPLQEAPGTYVLEK